VIRILHIITTLDAGGSEMMLYKLLSRMDKNIFSNQVVSLIPSGLIGDRIRLLDIPVSDLGMKKGVFNPLAYFRLIKLMKLWKPLIIQTWLYHADLLGLIAAKTVRRGKVIWNVRCSYMDLDHYSNLTSWTIRLCARLSPLADSVISNSHAAKKYHIGIGYISNRFTIIPNGFDLEQFRPDIDSRIKLRRELCLSDDTILVGLIARFDHMKDHKNFLAAIKRVLDRHYAIHIILCGEDVNPENLRLRGWLNEFKITSNVHLLGLRDDVPYIMAGLDILVSSSLGESFPNVIGEAMSCGVPCVATDVGDSARIVGETGMVVPPQNREALTRAISSLLELTIEDRRKLGQAARARVKHYFSLDNVVKKYEKLYSSVATFKYNRN
jgi:glycosyltransferase involved in cell wall biosynthesis